LEDTQNSEVQEALRRLKLEEAVRDQDKKLQEYERSIQDLERELEDVLQQLSQQEPRFTSVMSSLEDLRVKISGELKNISALNSLCSQVLRGIANKDYSSMFTFYNFAQVDNNVITLLDSILEATRPFSKGLVIPFDSGEEPGKKLNDLEKDLLNAKARVVDIQKLNPELTKTYQTLQAVRISSAPELHRLETDVNTARALVMSKKRMLEDRRKDLKLINDTIQSLLGTENLQSLKLRINQLRQALPKKLEEMLEQYERLAHIIGYSDP